MTNVKPATPELIAEVQAAYEKMTPGELEPLNGYTLFSAAKVLVAEFARTDEEDASDGMPTWEQAEADMNGLAALKNAWPSIYAALREKDVEIAKLNARLERYEDAEIPAHDPKLDQDAPCGRDGCSHPYYRHFDTYDDMRPIGCKYCGCIAWVAGTGGTDGNE